MPGLLFPPDVYAQMQEERNRRVASTTQVSQHTGSESQQTEDIHSAISASRIPNRANIDSDGSHCGSGENYECGNSSSSGQITCASSLDALNNLADKVGMLAAVTLCRPRLILSWLTAVEQIRLQATCRCLRYRVHNIGIATAIPRDFRFRHWRLEETSSRSLIYPLLPRKLREMPYRASNQWTEGELNQFVQDQRAAFNAASSRILSHFNIVYRTMHVENWFISVPRGHSSCLKFAALGEIEGVDTELGKCTSEEIRGNTGLPRQTIAARDLKIYSPGYYAAVLYTCGRYPDDQAQATIAIEVGLAGGSSITCCATSNLGIYGYRMSFASCSHHMLIANFLSLICIQPNVSLPTKKKPETAYKYEEQFPVNVDVSIVIDFASYEGAEADISFIAIGLVPIEQGRFVDTLESIGPYGDNIVLGSLCVQVNPTKWMETSWSDSSVGGSNEFCLWPS